MEFYMVMIREMKEIRISLKEIAEQLNKLNNIKNKKNE